MAAPEARPPDPEAAAAETAARVIRPVFVVGTMRSGTTLLAELLGRSPHLAHCGFELKDLWSGKAGVSMASPKTRDLTCPECDAARLRPGMAQALSSAFRERMAACEAKACGAVLLNKNPHLCNKLPLVDAMFPDARFIWIHRQLPQVVASLKRLFGDVHRRQATWHWWPQPDAQVRARCWNTAFAEKPPAGVPPERVFPGGDVRFLAEYWLESNLAVKRFFAELPSVRGTAVQEEKLLVAADAELARIHAWLELPAPADPVAAGELDGTRNSRWQGDLDADESASLDGFVKAYGSVIASIKDIYLLNRSDGADTVVENDATSGNTDVARFGIGGR